MKNYKMEKTNNNFWNNYYVGKNETANYGRGREVIAVLDENAVRFIVMENGKKKRTAEFKNNEKEKCLKFAEKALNK